MTRRKPKAKTRPAAATLLPDLQTACADLWWRSETDAPFEVICDPALQPPLEPQDLLQLSDYPEDTPIQTSNLEAFFGPATVDQDGCDATEKALVERYRHLQQLLTDTLEAPQVYRLGEVEVEIYILGYTGDGQVMGVKTLVVET
jgi:hypothetical protein